ncbi:Fe-Mn family superoxide dismutase [Paenibacillus kobensis]|uniref:Fe-Mn family superoxide dismutase n=1 Tax=Paenibacillus kobensis TaxID=59841 RepID=UPI000FDA2539|nr:Fe-Mn family superoxide dismutase [Paenibacillus kobensis]
MLFVYGAQTPIRLLEEIRDWKRQEIEHAAVIRRLSPTLEPEFVWVLTEWEHPLRAAERVADRCLNEALARTPEEASEPELLNARADVLLQASAYQSQRFVEHLLQMLERSPSLAANPAAKSFVLHAVRESNGFLSMNESYRYGFTPDVDVDGSGKPPNEEAVVTIGAAGTRKISKTAAAKPRTGVVTAGPTAAAGDPEGRPTVRPESGNGQSAAVGNAIGDQTVPAAAPSSEVSPASANDRAPAPQVPIGGHRLPPLPYAYNALEPYIDETTMRIHHDKHHQSYVDGLNKAERELQQARQTGNFDLVKHWERELAFNGAGHYLHTLFWPSMAPHAGGQPSGSLAAQIRNDFGSFEAFKNQFSEAAAKVEGGGWAILVWSPRARRLEILTAEKHQNLSQWDVVPILPLDVWEHAYYLKHQNNRADYIKNWWNVVNWPYANQRFEQASKLIWDPF